MVIVTDDGDCDEDSDRLWFFVMMIVTDGGGCDDDSDR